MSAFEQQAKERALIEKRARFILSAKGIDDPRLSYNKGATIDEWREYDHLLSKEMRLVASDLGRQYAKE